MLGFIISYRGIEENPKKSPPSLAWKVQNREGYPEADWLHGGPQSIHLQTRRMRITLLQAPEVARQVPMDRGGSCST
jgi:hypothetical protein